jgi:hypothetical protein
MGICTYVWVWSSLCGHAAAWVPRSGEAGECDAAFMRAVMPNAGMVGVPGLLGAPPGMTDCWREG